MKVRHVPLAAALLAAVLLGCEDAENKKGVSWNGAGQQKKPAAVTTQSNAAQSNANASSGGSQSSSGGSQQSSGGSQGGSSGGSGTPSDGGATVGDAVPFSSLRWSFGGVNGSHASQSGVVIARLSCSRGGLSFRYVKNLSAWGRSHGNAGDYACFFVQKADGSWVGGKFDWISSSRTTRGFENIFSGYNGWSLAGVPNPCNAAFVILNHDCKRRSNVISGRWSR